MGPSTFNVHSLGQLLSLQESAHGNKINSCVNAFVWWKDKQKQHPEWDLTTSLCCVHSLQTKAASLFYKIHANQNKVTNNRTYCNQFCMTKTNRFGLIMLFGTNVFAIALLSWHINRWLLGDEIASNPFSPSFHPSKVSHQFGIFPPTACVTVIISAQMGQPTLQLWVWWRRIWHYSSAILITSSFKQYSTSNSLSYTVV